MMPARRLVLVPLLVAIVTCAPAARRPAPASAVPPTTTPARAGTATAAPAPAVSRTPEVPSGTIRVEIGDDLFTPAQIATTAGTSVTWVNLGQNPHTATAHDDSFASPTLLYGGTFTYTFARRGRYVYACLYHPNMFG